MKEEIINGIKYRLDEETKTAEVVELIDDVQLDDEKLTAEQLKNAIFNGYEGDIIIPETVVFNELTYRVTSIGERAFQDCENLTSITIPDSVTSIGEYAFAGCESLTTQVVIGEEIIGGIVYLLYCNRTAEVIEHEEGYEVDIIIPETVVYNGLTYRVTSIGAKSFMWCESLKSIVIPDGVTTIGEYAFSGCESLTKIAIPNSVTTIGEYAFSGCESLTKIAIPNSVTSIGKQAFNNCYSLTSITIPDNVKSIGDMTFSSCIALTEIVIPNSVTMIGYEAFELCSALKSIVIPARVTEIGERAFNSCSALTSIIVAEGNPRYDSRMNCNAIIETATNTLIRGCSQTIIPESVTEIGKYAFNGCESLTSIIIPENVTSIGAKAFRHCESLKSITIPASVKSVGVEAFDWCKKLNSITFQGTIAQWNEIELGFFMWQNGVPSAAVVHCTDGDVEI